MTLYYSQEGTKCRVAISFFPRNMLPSDLFSFYIKLSPITITSPHQPSSGSRKPRKWGRIFSAFWCPMRLQETGKCQWKPIDPDCKYKACFGGSHLWHSKVKGQVKFYRVDYTSTRLQCTECGGTWAWARGWGGCGSCWRRWPGSVGWRRSRSTARGCPRSTAAAADHTTFTTRQWQKDTR